MNADRPLEMPRRTWRLTERTFYVIHSPYPGRMGSDPGQPDGPSWRGWEKCATSSASGTTFLAVAPSPETTGPVVLYSSREEADRACEALRGYSTDGMVVIPITVLVPELGTPISSLRGRS